MAKIRMRHPDMPDEQPIEAQTEAQAAVLAKSGWEVIEGEDDEEPAPPVTVSEPAPPPPPAPQITDPELLEED